MFFFSSKIIGLCGQVIGIRYLLIAYFWYAIHQCVYPTIISIGHRTNGFLSVTKSSSFHLAFWNIMWRIASRFHIKTTSIPFHRSHKIGTSARKHVPMHATTWHIVNYDKW